MVIEAVGFTRKDRSQIEPESIHLHLFHPITQAIGDHLNHSGVTEVDGVSCAGVIDVITRIIWHQPVIAGIVNTFEGQRGAALIAFRRMVVDHVQDDLHAGLMDVRDHFF